MYRMYFSQCWIADEDGKVFLYYASSDTRMHVATSTVDKLVDYCLNSPADGYRSAASVETLKVQIARNLEILRKNSSGMRDAVSGKLTHNLYPETRNVVNENLTKNKLI